ncbi:MAG: branched-chain amino acid ABC transporter permease [Proteobacteria bacterium]|nr:MAG: branched-chain amino acid ABC transporter permease [Pseudomonadota bacterium]|tara:strand:+ start:651 stop:1679 length:1029 start_codon:yes stop_codon:yes gene_type:complete
MIELLVRINNSIYNLSRVHRLLPWLIAYLVLLPLPKLLEFVLSDYYIDLANRACLFILLCVGLNIVKGFCGQVTVGHIGLYAIGAVSSALLAINYGLSFWVSAPLAVLITGFAGIIVGLPSVRLEGAYLALATLGLGESVRIMIAVTPALGSSTGIMLIPAPAIGDFVFDSFERYYYLVMTLAVLGIYLSFAILRSTTGRAFQAIREDPIAAAVVGINVTMYKLLAFVISALYAGLAGALFAHMPPGYLHHNNFTIIEMVTLLLMVVLGGIGNIWGGVIGAIVVTIIYDQTKDYYFYQPLIFGITMVLLVVFMPRGIGGLLGRMIVKKKFIKNHEDKVIDFA